MVNLCKEKNISKILKCPWTLGFLVSTNEAPIQITVNAIKIQNSKKTKCSWILRTLLSNEETPIRARDSWFKISQTMV
jgi:hypothetical protein